VFCFYLKTRFAELEVQISAGRYKVCVEADGNTIVGHLISFVAESTQRASTVPLVSRPISPRFPISWLHSLFTVIPRGVLEELANHFVTTEDPYVRLSVSSLEYVLNCAPNNH